MDWKNWKNDRRVRIGSIIVGVLVLVAIVGAAMGDTEAGTGTTSAARTVDAALAESDVDDWEACKMAEDFVEDRLKSPRTAKFSSGCFDPGENGIISKRGSTYDIGVVVDSENGFGALVRSEFYVTVTHLGGLRWRLDDLVQLR